MTAAFRWLVGLQESVRGSPAPDKKIAEMNFVFACVWAFGGCMLVDKVSDYRTQFSKWWTSEWKTITFPEKVCITMKWQKEMHIGLDFP